MMKKGVSPVVATILLVAIVIVLALIVFLWARGFVKEAVLKKGENVDLTCNKVNLEVMYLEDSYELQITNIGNIPVYSINLKLKKGATVKNIPENLTFGVGQSATISLNDNYDSIKVYPVLLGQNKKNKKVSYTCKKEFLPTIE